MSAIRPLLAATLLLLPGAALAASDRPLVLAFGNKKAGSECLLDTDCEDNRCRLYPDGKRYCVALGKTCATPGSEGASPGKANVHGGCFECVSGMGWRACLSAAPTTGPIRPTETRNR